MVQLSNSEIAHEIDKLIGRNFRDIRTRHGKSAEEMGAILASPISYQQVQKQQKGLNRIPSSMLYQYARHLGVDIKEFFAGVDVLLTGEGMPFAPKDEQRSLNNSIELRGTIRKVVNHLTKAKKEYDDEQRAEQ